MNNPIHCKVTKKKRLDSVVEDEHVLFDLNRYADGANALLYMRPSSSPPRNRTHDRKHQKKKGSRSRQHKPNKLNLLLPLPDFRLHSVHHLLKYDREQSRADKSSAGSDHTSVHKHHQVCHLNPTSAARLDAMMKKKRRGVVKSASVSPAKSKSNLHKVSPTLPEQRAYSFKSRRKYSICWRRFLNCRQFEIGISHVHRKKRNRNLYLISFKVYL